MHSSSTEKATSVKTLSLSLVATRQGRLSFPVGNTAPALRGGGGGEAFTAPAAPLPDGRGWGWVIFYTNIQPFSPPVKFLKENLAFFDQLFSNLLIMRRYAAWAISRSRAGAATRFRQRHKPIDVFALGLNDHAVLHLAKLAVERLRTIFAPLRVSRVYVLIVL